MDRIIVWEKSSVGVLWSLIVAISCSIIIGHTPRISPEETFYRSEKWVTMSRDESLSCTVMFVWSKVIVIERERSFKYCTLSIIKDFCLESQFEKKKSDQDTFAYFAYLLKCKQWYSTFCDFFLIPVFIFVHIRACILDRQPNAKFKRISYSILKREMYII